MLRIADADLVGSVEKILLGGNLDYLPLSYSRGPLPHVVNPQRYGAQSNPKVQGTSAPYANPFGTAASAGDSFTPSAQASVVNPAFGSYPQQAFTAQNLTNPFAQHAEETLGEAWANDSLIWGARAVGSHVADEVIKDQVKKATIISKSGSSNPAWESLTKGTQDKLNNLTKDAEHWRKVMGVGRKKITYGTQKSAFHLERFSDLFSKEGFEKYKEVLQHNFSKERMGTQLSKVKAGKITPRTIWSKTILGGNLESVIAPFKSGSLVQAGTGALAIGALFYGIADNTAKAWKNSRLKGDNMALAGIKTVFSLAGQTLKAGISWEAGTIGGVIGAGLFSFGAVPALIGTALVGALFGTVAHKAMSQLIPDET